MSYLEDESQSPYKRNLRFQDYFTPEEKEWRMNLIQFKSDKCSEEEKKQSSFPSESPKFQSWEERNSGQNIANWESDQNSHSVQNLSFTPSLKQKSCGYSKQKTRFKSKIQHNIESMVDFVPVPNFNTEKQLRELFEEFIVVVLKNFNPQLFKKQHLCKLNKDFAVFDRVLKSQSKETLLIYGVGSTGKTCSVDWALTHHRIYDKITIDCMDQQSQVSFILKLNASLRSFFQIQDYESLNYDYDNYTKKSLFASLQPFIQKSSKRAILIIENAQQLVKFTAHKILYNLSELANSSRKNIKIILITKCPFFQKYLERRERSRLTLIPLQMMKFKEGIIVVWRERLNQVDREVLGEKNRFIDQVTDGKDVKLYRKKVREWLDKVYDIFVNNQQFKIQLQSISKGLQNHLNAACWTMAKVFDYQKFQFPDTQQLKYEVITAYRHILDESNSLPSKNLLKNSNLDQKIFMALVFTMLSNQRRPYSFKTILRISWEFQSQKVEKCHNIYFTQNCLRKAYLKLLDKKIIYYEQGTQNQSKDKDLKVSMNFIDIRQAILDEDENKHVPQFIKEVLCL